MANTLLAFCQANDAAGATTKKLAKQAILADYFRALSDDDDLRHAVRYAGGRSFAATDERTLNVGGAIFSSVALAMLRLDGDTFHDRVVRSGEIGEALATLWPADDAAASPPLLLADLAAAFDALASTGNIESKKNLLAELLRRCRTGREAAYVAKIIFGDLRTGVQEGVLAAAVALAFGREPAAIQRGILLIGDLGEVAVLARHDALASARFRLFHPIQFMLAAPQETAADAATTIGGRAFVAEDKLDGIRAQIHKSGDADAARVAIYTRTMDRTDDSFPDVVAAAANLSGDFLLDGEIVPYRDGVVLPFANIQRRLGRKALTAKVLADHPAAFIAFDILYRDGQLLMDRPLRERRAALEELAGLSATLNIQHSTLNDQVNATGLLVTTPVAVTSAVQIDSAFARSRQSRNEGLVLKDLESVYSPGRRGQMWLKLKTHLPTLDCVVTAAEYGHGKRRNSLSDYTFAVWDRDPADPNATLVNVGKAYSGVTDEEIAQLTELFLQLSQGNNGRVHQVAPKIVLEIAADQIQKSARHASGYALRFPRIKRVRWDKRPADADQLARVAELYESQHNFGRNDPPAPPPAAPTLFDGM